MKDFPEPRIVNAGEVRLAVYEAGDGPAVMLVHGWPEIAYSWKNQIDPLASAGYRVIAVDLKGFGRSDAPKDPALYDIRHMTDDLAKLLDALAIDEAFFCGHDWGGAIVWPMAQLHPDRVSGVIGVSTPHKPPPPAPPLDIIRRRFGDDHYFLRFQEVGVAEAAFAGAEERFFPWMFRKPLPRALWPSLFPAAFDLIGRFAENRLIDPARVALSASDIAVYVDAYRRSGFHGGVNLYRNINRNWEIMRGVDPVIRRPALHVGAELDFFLPPESADDMGALMIDLERALIPDCGHWVMWEKPGALNAILVDWLDRKSKTAERQ